MNIVLFSSISNNPHQALCTFFFLNFWCVFQNWEIKVDVFQNEVMHSSKIISLPVFHFQIKIEEQNLFLQQRNSLCSGAEILFIQTSENKHLAPQGRPNYWKISVQKTKTRSHCWQLEKGSWTENIVQLMLNQVLPSPNSYTSHSTGCVLRGIQ